VKDVARGSGDDLARGPGTVYRGCDPAAASLHVGSLLVIMTLVHAQRNGHTPIALVGGGTGLIGDPSGKQAERRLLSEEKARANGEAIGRQLAHFLDFDRSLPNSALLRNNLDWLSKLDLVRFLRDIGKHFSVNQMIARDSVRRRLEEEESGMSFTEFSYSLLQAYDFFELHRREGCTIQMGGSDQWGNITAGTELVRRLTGERAFGIVSPLVTNDAGTKFGKTEAGNIWLDSGLTSPYRFFQFWLNTSDADVISYLKAFTLLSKEEILEMARSVRDEPYRRRAQRKLAADITRRVHGDEGLKGAERATQALFGGSLKELSRKELIQVFQDAPTQRITWTDLEAGLPIARAAHTAGVASSVSDAHRGLREGSLYLNNERVGSNRQIDAGDALGGSFVVMRRGKKRHGILRVVDS